jgi:hypothetical protein
MFVSCCHRLLHVRWFLAGCKSESSVTPPSQSSVERSAQHGCQCQLTNKHMTAHLQSKFANQSCELSILSIPKNLSRSSANPQTFDCRTQRSAFDICRVADQRLQGARYVDVKRAYRQAPRANHHLILPKLHSRLPNSTYPLFHAYIPMQTAFSFDVHRSVAKDQ